MIATYIRDSVRGYDEVLIGHKGEQVNAIRISGATEEDRLKLITSIIEATEDGVVFGVLPYIRNM